MKGFKAMFGELVRCAFVLVCVGLVGCGGSDLHPVSGRMTLEDGSALGNCLLTFESSKRLGSAAGSTDAQGFYQLGTYRAADGARAGHYRIVVSEIRENDEASPSRIHARYGRFETSGLEWTVMSGSNVYDLKLAPADRKP